MCASVCAYYGTCMCICINIFSLILRSTFFLLFFVIFTDWMRLITTSIQICDYKFLWGNEINSFYPPLNCRTISNLGWCCFRITCVSFTFTHHIHEHRDFLSIFHTYGANPFLFLSFFCVTWNLFFRYKIQIRAPTHTHSCTLKHHIWWILLC